MSLLARLGLLFVLVPLLELVLLVRLGDVIGLWPTLAMVVLTGAVGAALARAEGFRVFFQFQREVARGQLPGQSLLDGISVLVGGAFLLTPGILTDFAGFALLLPPSRRWIQRRVRTALKAKIASGAVKFVAVGANPFAGFGGGAAASQPSPDLDPRNEIRVERNDGG